MLSKMADAVHGYAIQVSGIFNSLAQAEENRAQTELNNYKAAQEEKLDALENRYNKGLISQADYEAQVEAINKEVDAREKQLALEQWEREKQVATQTAVIDGIAAAIKSFASFGFPWGLIPMALSLATTGVQIAAIQSTPAPYRHGGWIKKEKIIRAGEDDKP